MPVIARSMSVSLLGMLLLAGPGLAALKAPVVHPEQWPVGRSRGLVDPLTEDRISALIASMSLEEKVGQTIQTEIGAISPDDLRRYPLGSVLAGGDSWVHGRHRASASAWLKLAQDFRAVSLEQRPGHVPIPVIFGIDAVHGHNNIAGAVLYPHNIGLGAMRDPDLVRRIGTATAEEVAATGIDWTFAPTITVPQDVRWGRSYEGYSQDPDIVRSYAAAVIEGLQGPPESDGKLQSGHIAATAKHFLADGGTHEGVDQGDARIPEAELIRTHAPGYAAAINAGVLTVMASFSSWQGTKMHGNEALLTDVLKRRMGFDGFVIGDWNGHAQLPGCTRSHCSTAINAGIDMFMAPQGWKKLYADTIAAVRQGEIPMARLDDAVRRILRAKFKVGLFSRERPYDGRLELIGSDPHRALAREAVRKSLVLLKNDGVLPIKASARVLVTGPACEDIGAQSGGWTITWQGMNNTKTDFPNGESVFAGIKATVQAAGGTVISDAEDSSEVKPDVAVVVYGENPYAEMFGDLKVALYNARAPLTTLRRLKARGIPVVSVFLSGRPLWVNPEINASNAFIAAWLPGTEGGGIADVLIGDTAGKPRADFTGRLPYPWPATAAQEPYLKAKVDAEPLFRLGYGLSYANPGTVPRLSNRIDIR